MFLHNRWAKQCGKQEWCCYHCYLKITWWSQNDGIMRVQNGILNNINQTYIFGGDNDASMTLTFGNLLEYTFVLSLLWKSWKSSWCKLLDIFFESKLWQLWYSSTKWIKKYMGWKIPWSNYHSKSVMFSKLEYKQTISLLIP